jgi:hypothetical protein
MVGNFEHLYVPLVVKYCDVQAVGNMTYVDNRCYGKG